ncbi:Predicted UbiA prenyltransferase [Moritella viscosa]|uniref:UbiA family prenyltransferase n=1 Tax=Moritella viscosa TaxID=80854 RepID=UPI00091F6361|nr:UbiA family prenyltransferase [Moritella viscosa]SGY89191.1 Predicted UbiA prenyltransferase [Moritella viscosa]
MTQALTLNDSIHKRILGWIDERFPLPNAVLFFILYLLSAVVARATHNGESSLVLFDIVSCLVTWLLFLLVRIFDEHKDYELDVLNHPKRVLQSGLVTLNNLKVLGVISIVSQVLISLYLDAFSFGAVTFSWAIMFVYLCLMGVEFFCGEWLEKRLTLYAFSHMLLMPITVYWLANLAVPGIELNTPLILTMLLSFVSGFCFEITRKTRGPEEERETVDSYSKIFGTKGSAFVIILLLSGMLFLQILLLLSLDVSIVWIYVIASSAMFVYSLKFILTFIRYPTLAAREKNETAIGLNLLVGYLIVIIATFI